MLSTTQYSAACAWLSLSLSLSLLLAQPAHSNELDIKWGLPDASAIVGKLFVYTVPPDAFTGDIRGFEFSETTGERLPYWLRYRPQQRQLIGVPSEMDVGSVSILVTAYGPKLNATHTQVIDDAFSIHVREEAAAISKTKLKYQQAMGKAEASCEPGESQQMVLVLLDVDLAELTPFEKAQIVELSARQLSASYEKIRLYTPAFVTQQQADIMLMGPGDERRPRHTGGYLAWRIGCGKTMDKETSQYVAKIEHLSESGELRQRLGYGVVSWQVRAVQLTPRKRRRQFGYMTPTPLPTQRPISVPTARYTPKPTIKVTATIAREQFVSRVRTTRDQPWTTETTTAPSRLTTSRAAPLWTSEAVVKTEVVYSTSAETEPTTPATKVDSRPQLVTSIGNLMCVRGQVCHLLVPEDTFEDEDGDAHDLTLKVQSLETVRSWLSIDPITHTMQGITMHTGKHQFRLMATDSAGHAASTAFTVEVVDAKTVVNGGRPFSHRVQLTCDLPFHKIANNTDAQMNLVQTIATALTDADASLITVRELRSGSTIISWSNTSLPLKECADTYMNEFTYRLIDETSAKVVSQEVNGHPVTINVTGAPNTDFQLRMTQFGNVTVSSVTFHREGACLRLLKQAAKNADIYEGVGGTSIVPADSASESALTTDELLYSTLIPILVILLLLLVACVVACVMYRRNRTYKLAAEKDANSSYVSKGMPVMFPEEMDSEREPMMFATSPMLVKEERPPLAVPTLDATASHTRLKSLDRNMPNRDDSEQPLLGGSAPGLARGPSQPPPMGGTTEHENPLYKPPPPIELSQTRSPRTGRAQLPGQRQPPPYVPP